MTVLLPLQHPSALLLTILMIISTLIHPISSLKTCTNYVNGDKDIRQCEYDCCLSEGSYAIALSDAEVCSDEQRECGFQTLRPTSCPIRVDNKFEMFGCDVGEVCCNPLDDPVPEFRFSVPDKNVVCSSSGRCTTDESGEFDVW